MSINYPASLDTLTNPTGASTQNSPDHAQQHSDANDAVEALEAKLGTGASTATAGKVLRATGTGTTAYGQVDVTTDVAGFTSANLRTLLSDETGTGFSVFSTSPSLTTPAIANPSINAGGSWTGSPTIQTPTIASFVNATHDHSTAAQGGLLPVGTPIQMVSTSFTAVATGTTLIPLDDTIPQNTEGDEYMTLAITPKSTTNILVIEATAVYAHSVIAHTCVALFQDTTANALAAEPMLEATANGALNVKLEHRVAAGTTSATTFKIRIGGDTAGTTTFNGRSGGRLYGAITKSTMKITEYRA